VEVLNAWRKEQTTQTLAAGRTRREYVFTNTRDSRLRQDSQVTAAFARICRALGLVDEDGKPRHSLYDLRSTFATIHIMAGRVAFAQHQLGHKHQQTTTTHYFKWLPTERAKGFSNLIRKAK
jgi:integrase